MFSRKSLLLILLPVLLLAVSSATIAQARDSDGDGLPDTADRCPTQPGPRTNGGCPLAVPTQAPFQDRDSDGVADFVDACPDAAGTGFSNGCPLDVTPIALPGLLPDPEVIMVWDSTKVCMVGVPLGGGAVNVREEPSTSAPIIGQLSAGDQFEPWFRDYDENNAVWFGGAPAGNQFGWVADSVVIDNGACVYLPMVIHIDATNSPIVIADFNPDIIPEEQPDEDGWPLVDLLKLDLSDLVLVVDDTGDAPPTPEPEENALPGLFKLDGLNILFCDGSVMPTDQNPAACDGSVMPTDQQPLPIAHRQQDGEVCTPVGPGLCLDALVFLPQFGDGADQCTPDDFTKGLGLTGPDDPALIGLLLPAVQKVREAAARMGDGSVMPGDDVSDDPLGTGGFGGGGNVMQDFHFRTLMGDGSVMPGDDVSDDPLGSGGFGPGGNVMQFLGAVLADGSVVPAEGAADTSKFGAPNAACAMTVLTPGAGGGAFDVFVVLLPAVQ